MEFEHYPLIRKVKCTNPNCNNVLEIDINVPAEWCTMCGTKIFAGLATSTKYYRSFSAVTGLAINTPKKYILRVPNTNTRVHITFMVISDQSSITVQLFENPTLSDIGTAMPIVANDRNSDATAELLMYEDPTITTDGTILSNRITVGMISRDMTPDNVMILKKNVLYELKVIPIAKASNISIEWYWMEVK